MVDLVQGPLSGVASEENTSGALPTGPYKTVSGGKGGINTIAPNAGVVMDESTNKSILNNMQKMLDEYNSPMHKFQTGIDRAIAYTHYDPTLALREANEQEERENNNKFNISQNMATLQAMGNQGKQLGDFWNQKVDSKGTPIVPDAGGSAAPGMTRFEQSLIGLPAPIAENARSLFGRGYIDAANKSVADYVTRGMPNDAKMAEYIKTLPPGSPERTLLEGQTYKDVIGAKKVRFENGQEIPYTVNPNEPQPSIPSMKAALQPGATSGGTGIISLDNVTSPQGARNVPGSGPGVHNGVDLKAAVGTPVTAFAPGKVLSAGDANDNYGTKVVIQHPDGTTGIYAHLSNTNLKPGDTVSADTILGASGQTGNATGPHLHAEVRDANGNPIDAKNYYANASKQQTPTTLGGLNPASTEGVKALSGDYERAQQSFDKDVKGPLLTQVAAETAVPENVGRALSILKTTKVGPGTSMSQALLELKGVVKNLSPEEINTLNKVKTLDQTQKQLLAAGVKSAFGGQLSDKESDRYIASLYKIDDPKQFVQASLELIRANAIYKQQAAKFMQTHPHNSAAEFEAWKNGGKTYSEIMRKEAPFAYQLAGNATSSPSVAAGPKKTVKFGDLGKKEGTQ